MTLSLKGENISAYMMNIQYPSTNINFNEMQLNSQYLISDYNNLTYLFVGSMNGSQIPATLSWLTYTTPQPPGPTPDDKNKNNPSVIGALYF